MRSKYILLFLLLSIVGASSAQRKTSGVKFHSINNLSFLNGQNEVSAGLQSINGFQKGKWFVGAGLGLDYYIQRSVPVFADLRYEFGKDKNKFFVYADGGINFSWVEETYNDGPVFIWENPNSSKSYNGVYTDAGMGYLISMKKSGGLVLSIGHSHKTSREDVTYIDWRTQQPTTDIYRYKFNRVVVKVGWKF